MMQETSQPARTQIERKLWEIAVLLQGLLENEPLDVGITLNMFLHCKSLETCNKWRSFRMKAADVWTKGGNPVNAPHTLPNLITLTQQRSLYPQGYLCMCACVRACMCVRLHQKQMNEPFFWQQKVVQANVSEPPGEGLQPFKVTSSPSVLDPNICSSCFGSWAQTLACCLSLCWCPVCSSIQKNDDDFPSTLLTNQSVLKVV